MIYLPASVKIFKNKLRNWETDKFYCRLPHQAKRNNELRTFLLSCLKASYRVVSTACMLGLQFFTFLICKLIKIWKMRDANRHINLIWQLPHGCWMLWVNSESLTDTCLIRLPISKQNRNIWKYLTHDDGGPPWWNELSIPKFKIKCLPALWLKRLPLAQI